MLSNMPHDFSVTTLLRQHGVIKANKFSKKTNRWTICYGATTLPGCRGDDSGTHFTTHAVTHAHTFDLDKWRAIFVIANLLSHSLTKPFQPRAVAINNNVGKKLTELDEVC